MMHRARIVSDNILLSTVKHVIINDMSRLILWSYIFNYQQILPMQPLFNFEMT